MLEHLVYFIVISCICFIWGLPLNLLAARKKEHPWYSTQAGFFAFLFLSGLLTISLFSSWLYLFIPLRFGTLALATIPLLITALISWRKTIRPFRPTGATTPTSSATSATTPSAPPTGATIPTYSATSATTPTRPTIPSAPTAGIALLIIVPFLFLALSSIRITNRDTQIYHLQIIQWAFQYKAVPGLANLFPRLGLGSTWFGLISIFKLPFFSADNYAYLNFTLATWFFIWLATTAWYHFKDPAGSKILCLFYFLMLLFALFDWQLFRDTSNSTNYDFIVTAVTFMVVSFLLTTIFQPTGKKEFSVICIFFALSTIAFKFSGVFILILVAYYLYYHRSIKHLALTATLTVLILTPVLIRNYIITGYPLYPISFTTGAPDWAVPTAMTDLLRNYITLSNRFYSQDFVNSYAFMKEHAFWYLIWFKGIDWQHRIIILLVLSSTLILFTRLKTPPRLRPLILSLFLMAIAWFLSAPSPRFGYGVLLPLAFLPLSIWLGPRLKPGAYIFGCWAAAAALCCYMPFKLKSLPLAWLHPIAVERPAYTNIHRDNINLHWPHKLYDNDDYRCYNTNLPCILQENPYLHPRGATLIDGFRMTPSPDSAFIQNYNY